jgi:hypothetical protein
MFIHGFFYLNNKEATMAVCETQNDEMDYLVDAIIKKFSFPKLDNLAACRLNIYC